VWLAAAPLALAEPALPCIIKEPSNTAAATAQVPIFQATFFTYRDAGSPGRAYSRRLAGAGESCQSPAPSFPGACEHTAIRMSKGDLLEMDGVIQDALGGGQYTIKVDQGGTLVRAQLSGRMRRHHIRVLPGDRVRVAVSPYDLTHGLIVYRGRS
jgi:translation initiation factor IF-1